MICPEEGDNPEKSGLIPCNVFPGSPGLKKGFSLRRVPLWEGLAAYQVVGGVKAYQAMDG